MDASQTGEALDPFQNPSRAESQTSTPVPPPGDAAEPQTATIGGFEVDNDEDDKGDADYEPPAVLGDENANDMTVTMSEDPSSGNAIQNTSPDVSSQAAQGPISGPVLNSSYSPAPVPNIDPSSVSGQPYWAAQDVQAANMQTSTDPTPVPDSPSAKGRLPHDRVGILQDRIEEDPRGDIPAWLELIAEHRSRNRLDSARETYERFLKVFPMAVSFIFPSSRCNVANTIPGRSMGGICCHGIRT
jgi:cleavage stimulation factor subunit 3